MPEISRFLGIIIYMYFNEHNPPHFHVKYNDFTAIIEIDNFAVLAGVLPGKVLSLVIEWASAHQSDLLNNWKTLQKTGDFHKIEPLV